MFSRTASGLMLILLLVLVLMLLMPLSWTARALSPGCHLHPYNVTIRSDKRGSCRGSRLVHACVGYCESSAFPSRYSVLLASSFSRNFTSVSRCCVINKHVKVKIRMQCPRGRRHDDVEMSSARACGCSTCRRARY